MGILARNWLHGSIKTYYKLKQFIHLKFLAIFMLLNFQVTPFFFCTKELLLPTWIWSVITYDLTK